MLIDKNRYKKSLADLWHCVFGDSYSYIELIFKSEYEKSILCFGELVDDEVVSAFYLIESELVFEGKNYKGYYLYAAATLPEYRSKGLMSKLIFEAEEYCKNQKTDFISLVPSKETLYGYYSAFGFRDAMYCCKNYDYSRSVTNKNITLIADSNEYLAIRNKYQGNYFSFSSDAFSYAADCLTAAGYNFYKISDESFMIYSYEENSILELISFEENCKVNETVKFGMIYPINEELDRDWKFTDIYMNIALD